MHRLVKVNRIGQILTVLHQTECLGQATFAIELGYLLTNLLAQLQHEAGASKWIQCDLFSLVLCNIFVVCLNHVNIKRDHLEVPQLADYRFSLVSDFAIAGAETAVKGLTALSFVYFQLSQARLLRVSLSLLNFAAQKGSLSTILLAFSLSH